MNILYIGSSGALSLLPFKGLLSSSHTVSAVAVYAPIVMPGVINNKVIALENESLALAANYHKIPLLDLSQPVDVIVEQCSEFSFDILLMSCYSHRLPEEIVNLAKDGCYNMHPSLLPNFRGPEPIFWQMKAGSELGVSWHKVVYDYDVGDVVAQKGVVVDEGASYRAIQTTLAEQGADLVLQLLQDLKTGNITSKPQDSHLANYQPYPCDKDFIVDSHCSAQQIYDFMCATRIFGLPYQYDIGQYRYLLSEAIDYDNNSTLETVEVQADRLYIPCMEGVLIATYTDIIHL